MKKSSLYFMLLVFLFQTAWSDDHEHEGTNPNYRPESMNRGVFGENYAGYGFLSSSEAQADALLQFGCSESEKRSYLSSYCGGRAVDSSRPVNSLVSESMRSIVLQKMRKQAAEYYALNIRSTYAAMMEEFKLEKPECIDEESNVWKISNKPTHNAQTKTSAKLEALDLSLNAENLAKALLFSERLESGSREKNCNMTSVVPGTPRGEACTSIQHAQHRLKNSFPALFKYATQGTDQNPLEASEETESFGALKDSISYLIGSVGMNHGSAEDLKTRGKNIIANLALTGPYRELERKFMQAQEEARIAPANSHLKKALKEFRGATRKVRREHLNRMETELMNVCKKRTPVPGLAGKNSMTMFALGLYRPTIVRQAILDMSPSERGLSMAVLCEVGVLPTFQKETQCDGVTGGPLPENTVKIGRWKTNDWPYGSPNHFELSKPSAASDAPYKVKLDVNFYLGPSLDGQGDEDQNGIPDEVDCHLKAWQEDLNAWSNCSSGVSETAQLPTQNKVTCRGQAPLPGLTFPDVPKVQTTCPLNPDMRSLNPKVSFEFNLRPTRETPPPKPSVALHHCFRMEIGAPNERGNCGKVREFNVNKCVEDKGDVIRECLQSGKVEDECREIVFSQCRLEIENVALTDEDSLNRPDSANYVVDESFSNVRHEIFHQLGLPDEYPSNERPFNLIGEPDSIMRSSRTLDAQLYPRHMNQLLDVLRCPDILPSEEGL